MKKNIHYLNKYKMPVNTRSQSQTYKNVSSMPDENRCRMNNGDYCYLGQSCIVDRRLVGDWVHEDDVFDRYGLPRRINCYQPYTNEQQQAIEMEMNGHHQLSINDRWYIDAEIEEQYNKDYKEQTDYD